MGASESNPVRNLDKRTARRTYRDDFKGAVKRYRTSARVADQWAYLGEEDIDGNEWADGALRVCVRKRPIFRPEIQGKEFDVLTVMHDKLITVHDARMHADMRRQLMNHHEFIFDHVFNARADNDEVYRNTAAPLVNVALNGGFATCLMYGQTGSGKTYTMTSIYERASFELFERLQEGQTVSVSFVEIAGDKCNDLFNGFKTTQLLTGKDESVHAFPVVEPVVETPEDLLAMINHGCTIRTTEATGVHDASSRSHAILRIYIQKKLGTNSETRFPMNQDVEGTLTLVDLAGSEHRIDSMYHTAKLRKEGSQINASLMALKQCVHAKASGKNASHIYRKSKLTMALKMSFMLPSAKTVVIATVSPSSKDTEHSLNTLRHACVMDGQGNNRKCKSESTSSHIEGGNVRTVRVGVVQVSKEARKMKLMNDRERSKLVSNGNTFGHGAAHTEWAKAPTEKEIEKQHRASERSAFKKLPARQREILKKFRSQLGRDPRQEKRLQTFACDRDAWWNKDDEKKASIDQQWAEAGASQIQKLVESDPLAQGRKGFKTNQNINNNNRNSKNNNAQQRISKLPTAPPHIYRKLKSMIFNDVSLHINIKKKQLKKLLKKKGYSSDVPELQVGYVSEQHDYNHFENTDNNNAKQQNVHGIPDEGNNNGHISYPSQNSVKLQTSHNSYSTNDAFIPSESFNGLIDGYAYKNGHLGVGYYLEHGSDKDSSDNVDNRNISKMELPYGGDINEAMRVKDRDAIRKILATRSDYRSDSRQSNDPTASMTRNKENNRVSIADKQQTEQTSLLKEVHRKPAKSRHQLAKERRQKQIEKEQAERRNQVSKKSSSRMSGGRSLNDEIEALELEIANATTAASKVGLKKRLAQKKAILIRQERKAGQARREAERAAEAERLRKKQLAKLAEDNGKFEQLLNGGNVSPLSHAVANFPVGNNNNNMMQQQQYQQGFAPQQYQQQFQPPIQQQQYRDQQQQFQPPYQQQQYRDQQQQYHRHDQQQFQQYQQQYNQLPMNYNQQSNNFQQREVDADNWSPGDWRKMSSCHQNQIQKGGVSSAPFANDYTWNKDRY
jgi:hypothetical protein